MSGIVGLVKYGLAGNIPSIEKALQKIGAEVRIVEKESDFEGIERLVLPGVGSFTDAMEEMESAGIRSVLQRAIESRMPVLGICLGMQVLGKIGFEFGETRGLNWIDGEVRRIECKGSVPHIGFNTVKIVRESPLLQGLGEEDEFYFMHSYEVRNYTDVVGLTTYSDHVFVSAVQRENIFGVQFHPEKSREAGLKVFQNFLKIESRKSSAV
ncbi:MAG: imidazole glycerol phosphate synthase subunit HisH [Leptospiraceae bacterium]|nr:imidazole glycerol phosphate synthase subunit HisH [Leptospiraceae bacterium]